MSAKKRAIGIVRVSRVGDRTEENFASPVEQRGRLEDTCARQGWELATTYEELNTSGKLPLEKRTRGLLPAVQAIEAGNAQVLLVPYFDRLCRSNTVRAEVVQRVEKARGEVFAADLGKLSNGTAIEKLNGTLLGAVAEYVSDTARERAMAGQAEAIKKGHIPMRLIRGLRRGTDGTVELDPSTYRAARKAFEMRLEGKTLEQIRDYLQGHGMPDISYNGVKSLLASRQAYGHVEYRGHTFPAPALVDKATWDKVQKIRLPRGRPPKSDHLLARQGVLRCGNCGSKMVIGMQTVSEAAAARGVGKVGAQYPFYRCGAPRGECKRGVTISAHIAEEAVTSATRQALADVQGRASTEQKQREAAAVFDKAQADLDRAMASFKEAGLGGEPVALETLRELRERRDAAEAHKEQLGGGGLVITFNPDAGWESLTLEEQRAFIRATIASATVRPGRGDARINIELV
jgi:DNA invertase Pin-like site-specific DNA recombinase